MAPGPPLPPFPPANDDSMSSIDASSSASSSLPQPFDSIAFPPQPSQSPPPSNFSLSRNSLNLPSILTSKIQSPRGSSIITNGDSRSSIQTSDPDLKIKIEESVSSKTDNSLSPVSSVKFMDNSVKNPQSTSPSPNISTSGTNEPYISSISTAPSQPDPKVDPPIPIQPENKNIVVLPSPDDNKSEPQHRLSVRIAIFVLSNVWKIIQWLFAGAPFELPSFQLPKWLFNFLNDWVKIPFPISAMISLPFPSGSKLSFTFTIAANGSVKLRLAVQKTNNYKIGSLWG